MFVLMDEFLPGWDLGEMQVSSQSGDGLIGNLLHLFVITPEHLQLPHAGVCIQR
jgi:hypothetical protein